VSDRIFSVWITSVVWTAFVPYTAVLVGLAVRERTWTYFIFPLTPRTNSFSSPLVIASSCFPSQVFSDGDAKSVSYCNRSFSADSDERVLNILAAFGGFVGICSALFVSSPYLTFFSIDLDGFSSIELLSCCNNTHTSGYCEIAPRCDDEA
jgi:hypothetical protein